MKLVFTLLLFIIGLVQNARCDNFQISFLEGNVKYYVSYAKIKLLNNRGIEVFKGTTDKYGRVIIRNLPKGINYRIEVYYKRRTCRTTVSIDNTGSAFKQIYFSSRSCL